MARRFTTLLLLAASIFTTMQARTEHIDITTPQGTLKAILQVPANPPSEVTILGGAYTIGRDYILTAQSLPIYETARQYDGPALVIHGKADTVVPYTYGKRFYDDLRHARLCLLDGEDHMYEGRENRPAGIVAEFLERELK